MNLERMRVWVDALKNDTAGQCVGELVDMRGCHCAVGVGLVAAGIKPDQFRAQFTQIHEFREWLDDFEGGDAAYVTLNGVRRSVFELNDRLGFTLPEIGEMLEREHLTPAP